MADEEKKIEKKPAKKIASERGPGGRFATKKKVETPEARAKRFLGYAHDNLVQMMAVLDVGGIDAARPLLEMVRGYLDQVDKAMESK